MFKSIWTRAHEKQQSKKLKNTKCEPWIKTRTKKITILNLFHAVVPVFLLACCLAWSGSNYNSYLQCTLLTISHLYHFIVGPWLKISNYYATIAVNWCWNLHFDGMSKKLLLCCNKTQLLVSRILLQLVFAKCSFIYTTSFGAIWGNGTNWDHIFIYRNRDDTVSYKSNHNVLPSYESGCKWFRGLQWPSRWYRESRKLPQCSCKSRRRLWWFRDAVIVTTIISQIATWSQWIKIVIAHLTIANEIYIDVQIHMVSRTMCVDIDFKIYMDCRDE